MPVTKRAAYLLSCWAAGRARACVDAHVPPMRAGGRSCEGCCVGRAAWPEPGLGKVHLQTHTPRQGEVRASLDATDQRRNAAAQPGWAAWRRQRLLALLVLALWTPLCLCCSNEEIKAQRRARRGGVVGPDDHPPRPQDVMCRSWAGRWYVLGP